MKGRIRDVDGLRAVAVMMVVGWHYIGGGDIYGHGLNYYLFRPGRSGVDLFFALSGFLITSILIENRGSRKLYKTFYMVPWSSLLD